MAALALGLGLGGISLGALGISIGLPLQEQKKEWDHMLNESARLHEKIKQLASAKGRDWKAYSDAEYKGKWTNQSLSNFVMQQRSFLDLLQDDDPNKASVIAGLKAKFDPNAMNDPGYKVSAEDAQYLKGLQNLPATYQVAEGTKFKSKTDYDNWKYGVSRAATSTTFSETSGGLGARTFNPKQATGVNGLAGFYS